MAAKPLAVPPNDQPKACLTLYLREQVAAGLMNACLPAGTGAARLMLFVGGPATHGPGKVVDTDLQEPIRSHKVTHSCQTWCVKRCMQCFCVPLV